MLNVFTALFLFSPQQLEGQAALVRQVIGSGHSLGLLVPGDSAQSALETLEQGNALLEQIAWTRTRMVLAEDAGRQVIESLEEAGWHCWQGNVDGTAGTGYVTRANRIYASVEDQRQVARITMDDTEISAAALSRLLARLEQEGFHPLNAVGQLSDTYPGIILSDGILVEEQGLHLEYLVLTQESQAKDLAQGLQHQLYELVAARDPDITEESGEGYTLYTQETEGDYGVVVRDGTNILYVYCPQYDTTWMKWFLNDLGYLSDY